MTKAKLQETLNGSRARNKVIIADPKRRIKALEDELRQIEKDVARFGEVVQRFPRT